MFLTRNRVVAKTGPYIGITGFMSNAEVVEALNMVPEKPTHRLMVGVLMSSKTLAGMTNKYPGRYPKKEDVSGIFVKNERALNLIHYSTDHHDRLQNELYEITELVGSGNFDGFQLNVRWPEATALRNYQDSHPDKFLVVQMGGRVLAEVDGLGHLGGLIHLIYDHRACCSWLVDAVLIDPSGGKGQPFDQNKGTKYLREVRGDHPEMGIGIAGGLCCETLGLIEPLVKEFPNLSIDAEGKLRDENDKLNLEKVRLYLKRAFQMVLGSANH